MYPLLINPYTYIHVRMAFFLWGMDKKVQGQIRLSTVCLQEFKFKMK